MGRPLLQVEDSAPDAEALLRVARKLPLSVPVVRDGESALDYLLEPSGARERREASRALECSWFDAALLPCLEEPRG